MDAQRAARELELLGEAKQARTAAATARLEYQALALSAAGSHNEDDVTAVATARVRSELTAAFQADADLALEAARALSATNALGLSGSDAKFVARLRNSSAMAEMPDTQPSLHDAVEAASRPGVTAATLLEYGTFLREPITPEEQLRRCTPEASLGHALGNTPHYTRISGGDETTAEFQEEARVYLASMHADQRGAGSARKGLVLPDAGDVMAEGSVRQDNATSRGMTCLLQAIQRPPLIQRGAQGRLRPEHVRACMAEGVLSRVESVSLAGVPGMPMAVSKWTNVASASQLAVSKHAHQSNSKEAIATMGMLELSHRCGDLARKAFSPKCFKLHEVKVKDAATGEMRGMGVAAKWALAAYRRDRLRQEGVIAKWLLQLLQDLTRAGYTPIELRRAYTIYWRLRMRYNLCVLNAGHCAYAAEHIRTGTVPKAVDAMLSIKPIVTPLTKE